MDRAIKLGSLFTGYGGLDLAAETVTGAEMIWHSEINTAAMKVISAHWPGTHNIGDIEKVSWPEIPEVDILTGGFPCQDVSIAGKRAGLSATRSGLWSKMADAIDHIQPSLVIIENVRGILSATAAGRPMEQCPWCLGDTMNPTLRALGAVLGDLADIGYDARWEGLSAASVGAPHNRYRIFITATPRSASHTEAQRRPTRRTKPTGIIGRPHAPLGSASSWGKYGAAIKRWEETTGRTAPPPTELRKPGKIRLSALAVEFIMGLPEGWVTGIPGIKYAEQLQLLGNGVVPQQAEKALQNLIE